jgi:hypothetical protein
MKPLYDVNSAARLLSISPWTVRSYIHDGKLKAVRIVRKNSPSAQDLPSGTHKESSERRLIEGDVNRKQEVSSQPLSPVPGSSSCVVRRSSLFRSKLRWIQALLMGGSSLVVRGLPPESERTVWRI